MWRRVGKSTDLDNLSVLSGKDNVIIHPKTKRAACARLTVNINTKVCCTWNVMAHTRKPDFVFRRNGRVHLNRRGRQFSRLLAAELCASVVVMLDAPCSEVVWRVLGTHSIRQLPLHFPSRASPCAITFQLDSTQFRLHRNSSNTHIWSTFGWRADPINEAHSRL